MIFAIYYTLIGKTFLKKFGKFFPYLKDLDRRFPVNVDSEISFCFQSIKRCHPRSKLILLTDLNTPVEIMEGVEVIRYDVDPEQPAYMRLIAQQQFLKTATASEPIVFCDYDLLFQESIEPLFKENFDLALIYRKSFEGGLHPAPINGGFIGIHPEGFTKAINFLETVHSCYLENYSEYKEWGGFQSSLNKLLVPKKVHNAFPNHLIYEGAEIALLPSSEYNYAIEAQGEWVDFKPDKKILHFKGPRKEVMANYWNDYLA